MPINAAAHSALHQQIEEARFWDDNVGALFPVSTQQQRQDLIGLGRHGRSKEQLHMLVDGHILHNLRAALTAPTRKLYGKAPPLSSMFQPPVWVKKAEERKQKRKKIEKMRRKLRQLAERGIPMTGAAAAAAEEKRKRAGLKDNAKTKAASANNGAPASSSSSDEKPLSRSAAAKAAARAATPLLTPDEFATALHRLGVGLSGTQCEVLAKRIAGGGKDQRVGASDLEKAMATLGVPLIFGVDEVKEQERRIARKRAREAARAGARKHEAACRIQAWARGVSARSRGDAAKERAHRAWVEEFEEEVLPNGHILRTHHPERGSRFVTIEYWYLDAEDEELASKEDAAAAAAAAGDGKARPIDGKRQELRAGPRLVGADVRYTSSARYVGGWALRRGLRHGDGVLWAAGSDHCVRGTWVWGSDPSQAVCWYADGSVFCGGWARGNPEGEGVARYGSSNSACSLFRLAEQDLDRWVRRKRVRDQQPEIRSRQDLSNAKTEQGQNSRPQTVGARFCAPKTMQGTERGHQASMRALGFGTNDSTFPLAALMRSTSSATLLREQADASHSATSLPAPVSLLQRAHAREQGARNEIQCKKVRSKDSAAEEDANTISTAAAGDTAARARSADKPVSTIAPPEFSAESMVAMMTQALLIGHRHLAAQEGTAERNLAEQQREQKERTSLYRGTFEAGERSGQGTFFNSDGILEHEGIWRGNKPVRSVSVAATVAARARARAQERTRRRKPRLRELMKLRAEGQTKEQQSTRQQNDDDTVESARKRETIGDLPEPDASESHSAEVQSAESLASGSQTALRPPLQTAEALESSARVGHAVRARLMRFAPSASRAHLHASAGEPSNRDSISELNSASRLASTGPGSTVRESELNIQPASPSVSVVSDGTVSTRSASRTQFSNTATSSTLDTSPRQPGRLVPMPLSMSLPASQRSDLNVQQHEGQSTTPQQAFQESERVMFESTNANGARETCTAGFNSSEHTCASSTGMCLENGRAGGHERRVELQPESVPAPVPQSDAANWADVVSVAAEDWQCTDVAALLALLFTNAADDCHQSMRSGGTGVSAHDHVTLSEHLATAAVEQGIDGHALCALVEGSGNSGVAAVKRLMGPFARETSASVTSPSRALTRIRESWEQLKHLRKVQNKLPSHRFLPLLYEILGCSRMP